MILLFLIFTLIIIIFGLCVVKHHSNTKETLNNEISTSLGAINENFNCNHYKFKSDEEYERREKVFNSNGYMKGKLSSDMNDDWKQSANTTPNDKITAYVPSLKSFMERPLKPLNKENYFISVVCMFRYEDEYLEEWLNYYIMHGIEHFFLYSNENPQGTFDLLYPYIDAGYVTFIEWNNDKQNLIEEENKRKSWDDYSSVSLQNIAFQDFVRNHKDKTKWIIKVDVDEFMYPEDTNYLIKDILQNTKSKLFEVPRRDFGNNEHKTKPVGLVLENYTRRADKSDNVKSMALTEFISPYDEGSAHLFKML